MLKLQENKMNNKIQTFLDNYTCEFEHGQYCGNFSKRVTLHKLRDQLTVDDWHDIKDAAFGGWWEMPSNLQRSLNSKFNRLIEYQLDNGYGEFVTPESIVKILKDTYYAPKQFAVAQQLIWGVLTSCIEAVYWNLQNEIDEDDSAIVYDWLEYVE